jgi:hypothetical protein
MRRVVLFNGGDAGGLIITDGGVRPIPPFAPYIRLSLKAAAAMVRAVREVRDQSTARTTAPLALNLCNLAVSLVEEVVGPLDADSSLVFQDDDGGFTCGSTGKPPIPLPWPPKPIPSVSEVVASGIVDLDLVEFLRRVKDHKAAFIDAFEKPMSVAKSLGVPLSEKSAKDLQVLAPSRLADIADPVDREIVGFFHGVAKDGRYLETWTSRPYEVSQSLRIKLTDAAVDRIVAGGAQITFVGPDGGRVGLTGTDIVVIVIIITFFPSAAMVNDRSGLAKI